MRAMDVTIPGSDGDPDTPGFAMIPPDARRGAVVIHEILGRQPEIDRVVARFAGAGYAAVAPDLFAGGLRPLCIARVVRACATGEGQPIRQALAARQWLCDQAGLDPARVGLIGFCLGGGFALAAGRGWGAVSANYGQVPSTRLMEGIGPVIACYGENDRVFVPQVPRLRRALAEVGAEHEVHTFPGVGHSFLTDGEHAMSKLSWPLLRITWNPEVAEDAWTRIFGFFDRHLAED